MDEFVDTVGYKGPERRKEVHITQEQIERIADKAARRALEQMINDGYKAVGKNVVEKGIWIVGVIACSLFAWLATKGFIKI